MRMEPAKAAAIKKAIKANFDASVQNYDEFEAGTGLFSFLSLELARVADVEEGARVVDVCCGTGVSTRVLLSMVGRSGHVTGIDFSPKMLEEARRRCSAFSNVDFIEGDAEKLEGLLGYRTYDAILYNACIFLLPDAGASLRGARNSVKPGGRVAMNFVEGSYIDGRELFTELFPEWSGKAFPAPKFPSDTATLEAVLAESVFTRVQSGTMEKLMPLDHLKRFYQVPAQSASLYPRLGLAERKNAVQKMFKLVEEKGVSWASMRWKWVAATR